MIIKYMLSVKTWCVLSIFTCSLEQRHRQNVENGKELHLVSKNKAEF
jgi:hypothetical protein